MRMPICPWRVGVVILGVLLVSGSLLAQPVPSRENWMYDAADWIARFNAVAEEKTAEEAMIAKYNQLLEELKKFDPSDENPSYEAVRKCFTLLARAKAQGRLGNTELEKDYQGKYEADKATLRKVRQSVLSLLEAGFVGPPHSSSESSCLIELKGQDIQVRTVDYPIEALLNEVSNAVGERFLVPLEVSGRVDVDEGGFVNWRTWLDHFVRPRGLISFKEGAATRIRIVDPQYMSSLSERGAALHTKDVTLTKAVNGIRAGWLLYGGKYVAPPYQVDVQNRNGRYFVCVNGMPLGAGFGARRPMDPIVLPTSTQFDNAEDCVNYLGQRFAIARQQAGLAEAAKQAGDFLRTQKLVKEHTFIDDSTSVIITFQDGSQVSVLLNTYFVPSPLPAASGNVNRRDEANSAAGDTVLDEKPVLNAADKYKERVEGVLNGDGLVLVMGRGPVRMYDAGNAREVLLSICTALQEYVRLKEGVCRDVFHPDWTEGASDAAWELLLNLRYQEVLQRFGGEGQ